MSKRRIVLVGGGSGGHFYPLIAITQALISGARSAGAEPPDLYYMGPEPYDAGTLAQYRITFIPCPAGKRRKYHSLLNVLDMFKTLWGTLVALRKLFVLYPDVVMSKGSYTSVPAVLASWLLRIPLIVHESDVVPGSANKLAARFAQYVAISYPDTTQYFDTKKTALTGIPIRAELLGNITEQVHNVNADDVPVILVLGGSQGAERVNELIVRSLRKLLEKYTVVHQTGDTLYEPTVASAKVLIQDTEYFSRYHPIPFLSVEELSNALRDAHMVISRAGSGTIFEIAVYGKPSILIPIPEEISHDQRSNAYAYARSGGAVVMEEENLSDDLLAAEIERIMGNQQTFESMRTSALAFSPHDSAQKIAAILNEISEKH